MLEPSEGDRSPGDHADPLNAGPGLAELRAELKARDKTIVVLIARVERQFANPESAIAVLEQNIALEQKVKRRTQELEQSHSSLSRTLRELKLAQAQLLEANKLEAIGQLAAGIAHEINTPVQYVSDNTSFLKDAFESLVATLDQTLLAVREAISDDSAAAPLRALEGRVLASNLSWVREQIPRALEQSLEGLERVTSIVSAMKEFSHPSASEKQLVDLHDAIQTTITVASHEWKYIAEVETQFDRNIPQVPCLRNEFNQVMLNLIVNAAHAIGERYGAAAGRQGKILIATELVGNEVEVRIRDDGNGMSAAVGEHVYEPFFTTKPVGKGTGQGLAIARSVVVDKHGGSIRFQTAVGEGTCFFVRLPIAANAAPPAA